MTSRLRRWTRRGKSNDLSDWVAALRRHRSAYLGAQQSDLLGEGRFREVVVVALFLKNVSRTIRNERHKKYAVAIQIVLSGIAALFRHSGDNRNPVFSLCNECEDGCRRAPA